MPRRPASPDAHPGPDASLRIALAASAQAQIRAVLGLSEPEAAQAVGVGVTLFRQMVADGRMPPPRLAGARRVYDLDELRAGFKALPHASGEPDDVRDMDPWGAVRT